MANFNNPYDPDKDIWNEDAINETRNFDPQTANLRPDAPDWDGTSDVGWRQRLIRPRRTRSCRTLAT